MIQRESVEKRFSKFLDQIKDEGLRKKTLDIWLEAAKEGGWESLEEIENVPFSLLTDCRGLNLMDHTCAVTEGAIALAKAQKEHYPKMPYEIDFDRLIVGGLLHDVGKLLEIGKDGNGGYCKSRSGHCARHPISGAILAARHGMSEEIVNTIACHAKEGIGRPQVVETVLIHQADFETFNPLVMMKKGELIL